MKNYIIILLSLTCLPFSLLAQQLEQPYYYYQGEKVLLKYNTNFIFVSGTNENDVTNLIVTRSNLIKSRTAVSKDLTSQSLKQPVNFKVLNPIRHWTTLTLQENNLTDQQYLKLLNEIRSENPKLIIEPYLTQNEGEKIGVSNYILVKLQKQKDFDLLLKIANDFDLELIGHNEYLPLWFTLSATEYSDNTLNISKALNNTKLFENVSPNFIPEITFNNTSKNKGIDDLTPNDPLYDDQWHLNNTGQFGGIAGIDINAEDAWNIETGDFLTTIAIVDHGFDMNHADLMNNNWPFGFDTETSTSPAQVHGDHGTPCAGIVSANGNNGEGVSGVAPDATIMSISNNIDGFNFYNEIINGFNWANNNGAEIISNSWSASPPSPMLNEAISNLLENGRNDLGTIFVFSAGNGNSNSVVYPANSNPDILAVGAMSPCGERTSPVSCDGEFWWGSSFGNQLDIVAPGVLITTTDRIGIDGYTNTDYTSSFNGTSAAAPMVAGVAALILSANPNLTGAEVRNIIEITAQKVRQDLYNYNTASGRPNGTWHNEMGYGLVDAHAALLVATGQCLQNLTLTGTVSGTQTFQAQNTITSSQTTANNSNIDYLAGSKIVLAPGFKTNGIFSAQFAACQNGIGFQVQGSTTEKEPFEEYIYTIPSVREDISTAIIENEFICYPNPFNNQTTIQYSVDESGPVHLSVFDMNNQLVEVLVNNHQMNGDYSISFSSNNLPVGIYIARLTTDNQTKVIRMLVAK